MDFPLLLSSTVINRNLKFYPISNRKPLHHLVSVVFFGTKASDKIFSNSVLKKQLKKHAWIKV